MFTEIELTIIGIATNSTPYNRDHDTETELTFGSNTYPIHRVRINKAIIRAYLDSYYESFKENTE